MGSTADKAGGTPALSSPASLLPVPEAGQLLSLAQGQRQAEPTEPPLAPLQRSTGSAAALAEGLSRLARLWHTLALLQASPTFAVQAVLLLQQPKAPSLFN